MRHYNASELLRDFDGNFVKSGDKQLRYGDIIVIALMHQAEGEKLTLVEKLHRFALAQKAASCLQDRRDLRLEDADISVIMQCADKAPLTIYAIGKLNEYFLACNRESFDAKVSA